MNTVILKKVKVFKYNYYSYIISMSVYKIFYDFRLFFTLISSLCSFITKPFKKNIVIVCQSNNIINNEWYVDQS